MPSSVYQFKDGWHGVFDAQNKTGAGLLGPLGHANVKPNRAVKSRPLGSQDVFELFAEIFGLGLGIKVAFLQAVAGNGIGYAVNQLF